MREEASRLSNLKNQIYEFLVGKYGERKDLIVLYTVVIISLITIKTVDLIFRLSTSISLLSFLIGVIALMLSTYFTYKHSIEYRSYIREFRGYMTDLNELLKKAGEIIEGAKKSIKIAVDFFGIGSVTAKEGHVAYKGSLYKMAQIEEITITVIVLSQQKAKERTEEEFPTRAIKNPNFIKEIVTNDIKIGKQMNSMGIETKSHDSIPFHLFIVDDKKALFYIEEPVKENKGKRKTVGYVTEDPRMLDVFKELFKRIDDESKLCEYPL